MIKTKDPFKKLELEDKVKAYKANFTKLIRINKAKHYNNYLPENLVSNPKLFADDTSLFSVIRNKQLSAQNLNKHLNKINHWAFQWKINFNPDSSKQAQEVIFSRKLQKSVYPPLHFNNIAVTQSTT